MLAHTSSHTLIALLTLHHHYPAHFTWPASRTCTNTYSYFGDRCQNLWRNSVCWDMLVTDLIGFHVGDILLRIFLVNISSKVWAVTGIKFRKYLIFDTPGPFLEGAWRTFLPLGPAGCRGIVALCLLVFISKCVYCYGGIPILRSINLMLMSCFAIFQGERHHLVCERCRLCQCDTCSSRGRPQAGRLHS